MYIFKTDILILLFNFLYINARVLNIDKKILFGKTPWFLKKEDIFNSHINEFSHLICKTDECLTDAKIILSSINTTIDPCKNFYEFACGGWINNHEIPESETEWGPFNILQLNVDKQIEQMLQEPTFESDPSPVKSAKNIFKACLDTDKLEKVGTQPLLDLLNSLGGWPILSDFWFEEGFDWKEYLIEAERIDSESLLAISVMVNMHNSTTKILAIDQLDSSLLHSVNSNLKSEKFHTSSYGEWIVDTVLELSPGLMNKKLISEIKSEALQITDFESELEKITTPPEMRRDYTRLFNVMTLQKLQKWTDESKITHIKNKINWVELLNRLFRDTSIKFNPASRIAVFEPDYVFKLVQLLDRTPPRVVANYMGWKIVEKFSRDTTNKMRQLTFKMQKSLYGLQKELRRERECVAKASKHLSQAISYQYINKYFPENTKKEVFEIATSILNVFIEHLKQIKWMDDETRNAALAKANLMTIVVGYPYWYNNVTALENLYIGLSGTEDHFENVIHLNKFSTIKTLNKLGKPVSTQDVETEWTSVNAYNNLLNNSIDILAGILKRPFFSRGRLEALNYGSIGSIIGHEISHGFDDEGRQLDKNGNLINWWSDETMITYLDKVQCFIDQYNKYKIPELEDLLDINELNGVRTQGENIADSGGLRLAYKAYRNYVETNGEEYFLPGLEKYTPDQLFFIGYAMSWCHKMTQEELLNVILTDNHSLNRFRVIGAVSNSNYFAKVFHCPEGSPMNPQRKCQLW